METCKRSLTFLFLSGSDEEFIATKTFAAYKKIENARLGAFQYFQTYLSVSLRQYKHRATSTVLVSLIKDLRNKGQT